MAESEWRLVVGRLAALGAGPADDQRPLAALLGVELDDAWPYVVCAAVLRKALSSPLHLDAERPGTEQSVEYCLGLAAETGTAVPQQHLADYGLIDSWIVAMHDRRTTAALQHLAPEVGDIVERVTGTGVGVGEVSSISADGRLNFRGGYGRGVRPHHAKIRNRKRDDPDAWAEGHELARAEVARLDPTPERIGARERAGLQEYRVDGHLSEAAVLALREAVESATAEEPLQQVIEQFPDLLAHLVDHTQGAWVIPRPKLGLDYVPDFLVAAESSLGVKWLLVELEAPRHPLHTKPKGPGKPGKLSQGVRDGLAQITEWRQWLENHLSNARDPVGDGGLGPAGITPRARGLVIVGRGELDGSEDWRRTRADPTVDIRTYDWLLRAVERPRKAGIGVIHLDDLPADL